MKKNVLLWLIAIIFTLLVFAYQRKTGPTYPLRGKVKIDNYGINFKLNRSNNTCEKYQIKINIGNQDIKGKLKWKRYKSHDKWQLTDLIKDKNFLTAEIPSQPPAGKVEYFILLSHNNKEISITDEKPVIVRFKGKVPLYYLLPHIIFMILAMIYSVRAGIEALLKRKNIFKYTLITFIMILFGGMIFGPIVQKYAFGAFWTGFPFGHDLTDNKTLIAFIFWAIALYKCAKDSKKKHLWVLTATISTLIVYLIPHSVLGSEIDYRKST